MKLIIPSLVALFTSSLSLGFADVPLPQAASSNQAEASGGEISRVRRCAALDWEESGEVEGQVIRVVDGDTVKVEIQGKETSIRLLTIDTPETHYQGRSQGYWAKKAADYLDSILPPGTLVTVELDTERCDHYGRVLGYIWKDGVDLNLHMLEKGLAVNYCIYPNVRHCKEFSRPVSRSIRERIGMYSDPSLELPYEWRRKLSGRRDTKFVGNISTLRVYGPGSESRVPIELRIFFFKKKDIQPPYSLE